MAKLPLALLCAALAVGRNEGGCAPRRPGDAPAPAEDAVDCGPRLPDDAASAGEGASAQHLQRSRARFLSGSQGRAATAPDLINWASFPTNARVVCSASSYVCQLFVHLVFTFTPGSGLVMREVAGFGTLTHGASEAEAMAPGAPVLGTRPAEDERHYVNGLCASHAVPISECAVYGPSLVYSINLQNLLPARVSADGQVSLPEGLPAYTCVSSWMRVGGQRAVDPSQLCAQFQEPQIVYANNTDGSIIIRENYRDSKSSTFMEQGKPYTVFHFVFLVAPQDPVSVVTAVGEYSIDNGATWRTDGGVAFYEAHADLKSDGKFYQTWQYDVSMDFRVPPGAQIMFRLSVQDTATLANATFNGALAVTDEMAPFPH